MGNGTSNGLCQLIYYSQATPTAVVEMSTVFPEILAAAIRKNAELDITGALLECDGWFLQALEGPRINVAKTYQRISADARHGAPHLVTAEPIAGRHFADWNMCGRCLSPSDPALVTIFSQPNSFDPGTLAPESALSLLKTMMELRDCPE